MKAISNSWEIFKQLFEKKKEKEERTFCSELNKKGRQQYSK